MDGEARPSPQSLRGPCAPLPPSSRWVGVSCVLSLCLQTVVQQGLAPRARELRANSSALGEALLREQQRLGRGECRHLWGSRLAGTFTLWACVGVWGLLR